MPTLEELQAKVKEYEQRMGIGQYDPAKEAYLVLVDILVQKTDYLKVFKIKNKIAAEEKADAAEYKNAKELWEKLPDMIKNVNSLNAELKMKGEEKKQTYTPVSPKSIANGTAQL